MGHDEIKVTCTPAARLAIVVRIERPSFPEPADDSTRNVLSLKFSEEVIVENAQLSAEIGVANL
jgi:hypothetical protein